jgi:hypothetical protein
MTLSAEQIAWLEHTRFLSGASNGHASATAVASTPSPQISAPAAHAAAAHGMSARMVVPIEKTVSGPEGTIKLGTYLTVKVSIAGKLKGSFEIASGPKGDSSADLSPLGYSDGFVQRLGRSWYDTQGVSVFGVNTGASESKIEGQAKIKGGLEVSISGTLKWSVGDELKIKFNLVKIGTDWKVSAGQLEFSYAFKGIDIKAYPFENGTFKGVMQAVAIVKAEPNYIAIGQAVGQAGSNIAVGVRAVAAVVTFDAVIAFALVADSVVVVAGGLHGIVQGAEIRNLSNQVETTTAALTSGFIAGVQGQSTNPAGALGQAGFDKGRQGYATLRAHILTKLPDASDEVITEAIVSLVAEYRAPVREMMRELAKKAVWEAWAGSQTGWFDSKETLKWGWSAIFGKLPSASDAEYAKFYH